MMDQVLYIAIIAMAMVFGWYLYQRRANEKGERTVTAARRVRKSRPRKKS